MVSPISNVIQPQPVAPTTGTPAEKSTRLQPHATYITDSVQLSKAAQASLALIQEARETSAQTAQEAGHGDLQAQRLLAKEAAAKLAAE